MRLVILFDMFLSPSFKMANHFNLLVVGCHTYSLWPIVFSRFAEVFLPIWHHHTVRLNDIWIWKHRNCIFFIELIYYFHICWKFWNCWNFCKYCFNMYSFFFDNENLKLAGMQLGIFDVFHVFFLWNVFMFWACFLLEYRVFVKLWQFFFQNNKIELFLDTYSTVQSPILFCHSL